MVSINRPYDSVSGGSKDVNFIRCVGFGDPQLQEMWCLGSDNVTLEIHPKTQVEVSPGTVGEFTTNHLAENGRRILIIRQLSINGSVKFLGIPDFVRNSGLWFIENLQDPTVPTGWGHANTSNQNWGVIPGRPYSLWSVPWGVTVPVCPAYMPRSLENLRADAHHVRDDFLHRRCHECMRR